jgi:hypothetical protein
MELNGFTVLILVHIVRKKDNLAFPYRFRGLKKYRLILLNPLQT